MTQAVEKKQLKTTYYHKYHSNFKHIFDIYAIKKTKKTPTVAKHRGNFCQKKFTGKELDPETGLYYFGARYLDPKTSRWLSGDPALGEYLPSAPVNDEARKRNGSLPGMGGVFNYVNLHVYHYAGNNPVKLVDPDGKIVLAITAQHFMQNEPWKNVTIPYTNTTMEHGGCAITFAANIAYTQNNATPVTPGTIVGSSSNFNKDGLIWGNALSSANVSLVEKESGQLSATRFNQLVNDTTTNYYVGINVNYSGITGNSEDHWVGATALVPRADGNQYFRISPTSQNDEIMGTNVNGNNRDGRGWQVDTNEQGQVTDIYVPINQVKGYIIFSAQENQ